MEIKLGNFNLVSLLDWENVKILPGTKVCHSNGSGVVGVIVDVATKKQKHPYRRMYYPQWVKVLWGTGAKRGVVEEKDAERLVNFDMYLAKIHEETAELEKLADQASTVGL